MRSRTVLACLLLMTACSGGSAKTAATSAPLPTLPSSTPTTAAPTPTQTSASPSPSATSKGPAKDGDVDGDGKVDSVRTSSTLVTVDLSGSDTTITAPAHTEGPGDAGLLGSKDVDRDGFAELFLETAQGASTTFATPYRYDGKVLRELQLDGGPARLGIGGSVTHGDGFRCLPSGLLEVRGADSQDGELFTVHVDTYRLGTDQLVLLSSKTSKARQGDQAVEQSYVVSCGAVGDGG
jgi:hypothetical protein